MIKGMHIKLPKNIILSSTLFHSTKHIGPCGVLAPAVST
jgi:hypothetical protein